MPDTHIAAIAGISAMKWCVQLDITGAAHFCIRCSMCGKVKRAKAGGSVECCRGYKYYAPDDADGLPILPSSKFAAQMLGKQ
jgi:hypothetical protein